MNAKIRGKELRRKSGSTGRVDVEEVAQMLGYRVDEWDLPACEVHEVTVRDSIGVSTEICEIYQRWSIAHALGHRLMHPGNHVSLRAISMLTQPYEGQAEDFAYGLLVDEEEAIAEGLNTVGEIAEYFGVPPEMVRVQGRLC